MTRRRAAVLALAMALGGCAPAAGGDGGPAEGGSTSALPGAPWVVTELGGLALPSGLRATLLFGADGRVTGQGRCNRYGAAYALAGDRLAFGPAAVTRMACGPDAMAAEGRFLAALAATRAFAVGGDGTLRLRAADGTPLLAAMREG